MVSFDDFFFRNSDYYRANCIRHHSNHYNTTVYKMRIVLSYISESFMKIERFLPQGDIGENRYRIVKLSRYQSNYHTNVYVYLFIYDIYVCVGKSVFRINFIISNSIERIIVENFVKQKLEIV